MGLRGTGGHRADSAGIRAAGSASGWTVRSAAGAAGPGACASDPRWLSRRFLHRGAGPDRARGKLGASGARADCADGARNLLVKAGVEERAEAVAAAGVTELAQRLGFDLANALAG